MISKYQLEKVARFILFPLIFFLTLLKFLKIRFCSLIGLESTENLMLDIKYLCTRHSVIPRGVIHVGAHEGREINSYQDMGVTNILFVEANPIVFERLQENIRNQSDSTNINAVNCAINNLDGETILYVTSNDLSSSILPLKEHKRIYPSIVESSQVKVKSRKLDSLIQDEKLEPSDFNIINIDIQGAELIAFLGAINTLKYIEAINTEINYKELYEGCAIINQIDEFLETHGFQRVATITPFHPSWGDAFYVKKRVKR